MVFIVLTVGPLVGGGVKRREHQKQQPQKKDANKALFIVKNDNSVFRACYWY
jgi:hypothetical protein